MSPIPSDNVVMVHESKQKVDHSCYLENQTFASTAPSTTPPPTSWCISLLPSRLVESIFRHGMATCFAYGQTGSGEKRTLWAEAFQEGTKIVLKAFMPWWCRDVFLLLKTSAW